MNGSGVEGKLLPWGLIGLKGICHPNGDAHTEGWEAVSQR